MSAKNCNHAVTCNRKPKDRKCDTRKKCWEVELKFKQYSRVVMKYVRIDARTLIEVSVDKPDAEARNDYFLKLAERERKIPKAIVMPQVID